MSGQTLARLSWLLDPETDPQRFMDTLGNRKLKTELAYEHRLNVRDIFTRSRFADIYDKNAMERLSFLLELEHGSFGETVPSIVAMSMNPVFPVDGLPQIIMDAIEFGLPGFNPLLFFCHANPAFPVQVDSFMHMASVTFGQEMNNSFWSTYLTKWTKQLDRELTPNKTKVMFKAFISVLDEVSAEESDPYLAAVVDRFRDEVPPPQSGSFLSSDFAIKAAEEHPAIYQNGYSAYRNFVDVIVRRHKVGWFGKLLANLLSYFSIRGMPLQRRVVLVARIYKRLDEANHKRYPYLFWSVFEEEPWQPTTTK